MPVAEGGVSVDRNKYFVKCVDECVDHVVTGLKAQQILLLLSHENLVLYQVLSLQIPMSDLLKHLGMPVLRARGEAEALCAAQLNREGFVDACITADSDAFLFGAKCVIKHVDPKSTGPFECYYMEDIEVGLGLRRKHLIAVSLLVGNDHNLNGVQGIGLETAFRFVKTFHEDEVLQRLNEEGSGPILSPDANYGSPGKFTRNSDKLVPNIKGPHCSLCGHPGNKTAHSRVPCKYCHRTRGESCSKKTPGFQCECSGCDRDRKDREHKKKENWHLRVCKKIAKECKFPWNEIIEMYLRNEDNDGFNAQLLWNGPDIEMLIDFLAYYLHWDPSYTRQQIFPMLSTTFLRDMPLNPSEDLLNGQFRFDSIQRVKVRYGHKLYVVRWRNIASATGDVNYSVSSEGYFVGSASESEVNQIDGSCNGLDVLSVSQVYVDGGCSFILTDENLELVQTAFPVEVEGFLQQKEMKESNRRKPRPRGTYMVSQSPNPGRVQLAITDYYRSSKPQNQPKDNPDLVQDEDNGCMKEKNKASSASLPKSVRRRLLFS